MRLHSQLPAALFSGLALSALATAAFGQSAPLATAVAATTDAALAASTTSVGEILVTARRTKEKAQDVPIALSVLSGENLTKTGAYTLADVQAQTPSFTAYQSNARNSSIGIRGIGVSSASDGLDTSVGVYIDNVYLGRPGMALEDLIDLDRVEVLRGPQGTLFGRNSSAGVVNITTKAPSFDFGGTAEASFGDYGYNQEKVSVTGPIVDAAAKAARLTELTHALGLWKEATLAIGDGANDLAMMAAAGVSVAYRAKPLVRAKATHALDHSGLDGVLNLFE